MPTFRALIEFLVAISLVIAVVSNYLIINKLWKRRAVRDVAESISVGAALLGLTTAVPFLILFAAIDHSPAGTAKTLIGIITGVTFVLIGSGVWVPELRERRFFSLFLRALRLERKESTDLIKWLVQPKGADRILTVLHQFAAVDGDIDEGEIAMIREFARHWHLPEPRLEASESVDLLTLRDSVAAYLAVRPPRDQAAEFVDLLHVLTRADKRVTWEEAMAVEEVDGMMRHYLASDGMKLATFEVVIVPQSDTQVDAVRSLLPDSEEKVVRGGRVFGVGEFFSLAYAEMVCQKYIALGLFTTVNGEAPSSRAIQPT